MNRSTIIAEITELVNKTTRLISLIESENSVNESPIEELLQNLDTASQELQDAFTLIKSSKIDIYG